MPGNVELVGGRYRGWVSGLSHGNPLTTSEAELRTAPNTVGLLLVFIYHLSTAQRLKFELKYRDPPAQHTSEIVNSHIERELILLKSRLHGDKTITVKVGFESLDNVITVVVDEAMSGEGYTM